MSASIVSDVKSSLRAEFQNDHVRTLWGRLESTQPMPKISAIIVSKEGFVKVAELFVENLVNSGELEGDVSLIVEGMEQIRGFSFPYDSTFIVFVLEGTPEEEEATIVSELSRISWCIWDQVVSENNRNQYVR